MRSRPGHLSLRSGLKKFLVIDVRFDLAALQDFYCGGDGVGCVFLAID
ncbi:hypothetical protein BH10BDE1_BH10BDE1_01880 [soil metagenome]